jgi:hypothetical protein
MHSCSYCGARSLIMYLFLLLKVLFAEYYFALLLHIFFIFKKHGYFCTTNDKYYEKVQCLQLSLNMRFDF